MPMIKMPKIARIKTTSGAAEVVRSRSLFFDGGEGVLASFLVKASSILPGPITITLTFSEPLPNEPFCLGCFIWEPDDFLFSNCNRTEERGGISQFYEQGSDAEGNRV